MKKILLFTLLGCIQLYSQEQEMDSLNVQKLEEVLVSSVRVNEDIPMAFTNVSKDQIEETKTSSNFCTFSESIS